MPGELQHAHHTADITAANVVVRLVQGGFGCHVQMVAA
jgi:hypothetical protein